jgi:hypothetical protein
VAPVLDWRSEPARSTRLSLPTRMEGLPDSFSWAHSQMMVKMLWLLDDDWFMSVDPTERFFFPLCITWSISMADFTTNVVRSLT